MIGLAKLVVTGPDFSATYYIGGHLHKYRCLITLMQIIPMVGSSSKDLETVYTMTLIYQMDRW